MPLPFNLFGKIDFKPKRYEKKSNFSFIEFGFLGFKRAAISLAILSTSRPNISSKALKLPKIFVITG